MIYILENIDIALTMPDNTIRQFTLEAPTGTEQPFWYRIIEQAPSGRSMFKDPLRTRQKSLNTYRPEFHLSYGHHRMFTTELLAAKNIELITGFPDWTIDCQLANEDAVKRYLAGMTAASASTAEPNPVPSGELELVFMGRHPETWQQALAYYFYYVPGWEIITFDDTTVTWDSTEVVFQ